MEVTGQRKTKKLKRKKTTNRERRQKQKRKNRKEEQKEKRARTGKEGNSQISNVSKIGSNFGNSSYVESVIVKSGTLKINNRGTKTMEPQNKIKQISTSVKASNKNGKGGKVG